MKQVAPQTGAPEVTCAEDQLGFRPLVLALYQYPADHPEFPGVPYVLSRWRLTPEEREAVARGEDLYIAHLTFGGPLQPLAPQVGPEGYTVEPAT